jgi:hypothetical protein
MELEQKQLNQEAEGKTAPMHHDHSSVNMHLPAGAMPHRRRKLMFVCVALIVVLLIGMFWSWWLFGRNDFNEDGNISKGEFQAVFLTNGQVYFGKLSNLNHKYITINDVYYLQVQSSTSLQGASNSTNTSDSQVSLVKLGNELHGPQDEMYIANDQMLFWENLKPSGKVTQAIDKYQAGQ